MRGAIVGLGNVAVHGHLPGWLERPDVEIVAVADTRPAQRAVCAERLPDAHWFDSAESLLADTRLDFVDICTPPSSHAPLIRAALERGVHVLCEKPLVRSAAELGLVTELVRASGCVLHTVHNWHHAPIVRLAADLLRAGEIGRPTRVVWHTLRTQPAAAGDGPGDNWRLDPAVAGGGVLSDHGWHVCYVIQRWLGARPLAVQARLERRRHTGSPVEDTAALSITFAHATADVLLTWAADERRNWALIEGESGRIELHDDTDPHRGRRRAAVGVPAAVQWLPSSRLVRRGRRRLSLRGGGRSADGDQSRRGQPLRHGREPRARVEPAGRCDARPVAVANAAGPLLGAFEGDLKIAGDPTVARAAGLLLIVPAGSRAVGPHTRVAGLPLLRRIALAGSRAGLLPVLAGGLGDASLRAEGLAVELGADGGTGSPGCRRIIICPTNVIVQTRWLRALAGSSVEPETVSVDPSMVALVDTEDPGKVLAEAARASTADNLIAALGDRLRRRPASFDPHGRFPLAGPDDTADAEAWLLRSLVKDSEGFMSRHFERRISLAVTRRLAWTPITPNTMTLVSLAVGLSSAPFFLSARPAWQLLGALIFLTHSILDGCDGELARLKFLESPRGAMLDFWGDNVVHVAVFGCMAVGWSLATHTALPLLLGAAAIGAVAVATAVLSGTGLQPRPPGSEATARVVDALANRDFIYLVLVLSTVGRAWWFLALVATGTPIFVLAALWANRGRPSA